METCRERLKREHPDQIGALDMGGCMSCPSNYGYAPDPEFCGDYDSDKVCAECWDRPVKTVEQPIVKLPTDKVQIHAEICAKLTDTYKRKNADYGDSFAKMRAEFDNAILIRIYDKYSRLKTLMSGQAQQVNDESIDDTFLDLANYCIMELVERRIDNDNQ